MPGLANEFQQKQQLQAKQFAPKQTGPKEHPEDTLIVRNILVGDDTEVEEVIPYANARPSVDPMTGQQHFVNQIDTNLFEHSWNTREFFEVRWDGRPHRIRSGETRNMPRYLADHFAKYLIDFILLQREDKEKVTGLLKNRLEREKLYSQIIVGVSSYYNGDMWDYEREGNYVEQQVQQLNQPDNARNLGMVPNIAAGYGLTDKPPEPVVTVTSTTGIPSFEGISVTTTAIPLSPSPADGVPVSKQELIDSKTKNQLVAEAKALGIEIKGQENKTQLYDMITNF